MNSDEFNKHFKSPTSRPLRRLIESLRNMEEKVAAHDAELEKAQYEAGLHEANSQLHKANAEEAGHSAAIFFIALCGSVLLNAFLLWLLWAT